MNGLKEFMEYSYGNFRELFNYVEQQALTNFSARELFDYLNRGFVEGSWNCPENLSQEEYISLKKLRYQLVVKNFSLLLASAEIKERYDLADYFQIDNKGSCQLTTIKDIYDVTEKINVFSFILDTLRWALPFANNDRVCYKVYSNFCELVEELILEVGPSMKKFRGNIVNEHKALLPYYNNFMSFAERIEKNNRSEKSIKDVLSLSL